MKKMIIAIIISLLLLIKISFLSIGSNNQCIDTFENFAYKILDREDMRKETEFLYPKGNLETIFHEETNELFEQPYFIELIRNFDKNEEIWIKVIMTYSEENINFFEYLVYESNTKITKTVKAVTSNGVKIDFIFFNKTTNSIWGVNNRKSNNENIPLFSIYNDDSNQFEIVEDETSEFKFDDYYLLPWRIFLDQEGNFWVFLFHKVIRDIYNEENLQKNQVTGILYKYDTVSGNFKFQTEIIDIIPDSITIDEYGKLFLLGNDDDNTFNGSIQYRTQNLYTYNKNQKTFDYVTTVPENWISIHNIVKLKNNDIWFDSIGTYNLDNAEWTLFHPNIDLLKDRFIKHYYSLYFTPAARILFEDSNGRLWFYDKSSYEFEPGVAWFNPETNNGCWVTNYRSSPKEGPDGKIWMLIENQLYSYMVNNVK